MADPLTVTSLAAPLTITSEQINSLPLLLGIIEEMEIRAIIDGLVPRHGHWQGASVGTLVSLWLCHILSEREHRLVAVRDWVADRTQTIQALLAIELRATDCTDDRLATVLTRLGDPATQAALDAALVQRWLRVYALPVETIRLDSTSVSVYHAPTDPDSLLQRGHSKDHRPDLRQFKAMLATLDPLGMPLTVQPVAGQRADDGLYVPGYEAAVAALGTRAVLVVGDSKMGALATRGHLAAHGSRYLAAYRPPNGARDLAGWVEQALGRPDQWQVVETVDQQTGEVCRTAEIDAWERPQTWLDPATQTWHTWCERVLVVRSAAFQAGERRQREAALARLTVALAALGQPPQRGRKHVRQEADLAGQVAGLVERAGLTGVVEVALAEEALADGRTRWVVAAIAVKRAAWQAMVERLGWAVYLTNTTAAHLDGPAVVAAYRQQPVHERGFSRMKTETLHIRPVYLRDEQRIGGLLWLLCLALRVLTLTEHRVRTALAERQEAVVGLNPASRRQPMTRPTTERIVAAFANLTLTTVAVAGRVVRHVTPLNATQRHLLVLLKLPADLYARLEQAVSNPVLILRE